MSLPINIGFGMVSIYGEGTLQSSIGITSPGDTFLFGVVDQTWNGVNNSVSVGQSVMFKVSDIKYRVVYLGTTYTVVEEKGLGLTEAPPP